MKLFATLILIFISSALIAQLQDPIKFLESEYDFGTVKEEDGPIIHEFKFENNSTDSIRILNVKASCGCTTPGWTKEPVPPGESGFIKAQYNPRNRPGRFNKSLTITTDFNDSPIRLYIRGNVDPKPKSIEEELPTEMEGIRVKYRTFNMGRVYTRDVPTIKNFEVYNSSDSALSFENYESAEHITLEFDPKTLEPKEKGIIRVKYRGDLKKDLGFSNENVTIYTDQEEGLNTKSFTVFATVYEYFPPMTKEELENAPQLSIEEMLTDLGKIKEKTETSFTLTNSGKTDLEIRKTDPNCSCVSAELKRKVIKPGKSIELKVILDPEGRRGNQQKSVSIYSNDPRNSVQRVTIRAYILD